ncbi:MAG: hypothetical protein ACSLE5_03085 [Porticoccaceae bacterium]
MALPITSPPTDDGFANLIVVSTFYHLLLACLVARDPRFSGRSVLVMNAEREQMAALCNPLKGALDSPFSDIRVLPIVSGSKLAGERARGQWLAQLDDALRPARVIIFTDLRPDNQLLCRRAEARGAATFCGEDGGSAYSSRSWAVPWRRHWQRLLCFGPWLENRAAAGNSRHVQTFLALYPELVRPELQRKPLWPLDRSALPDLLSLSWIDRFLAHFQVSQDVLACDELYVPTSSRATGAGERLRRVLGEEIRAARASGRDCVVKYHPREPDDFLGAAALGARLLPAAIPVELIYQASAGRLRRVVGDTGTTLLSARWLAPQAQALSVLHHVEGLSDPWYVRTLNRLGVELLD